MPLSGAAVAIVESLPRIAGSAVHVHTTGTTPVSGISKAKTRLDALIAQANDGRALPDLAFPRSA